MITILKLGGNVVTDKSSTELIIQKERIAQFTRSPTLKQITIFDDTNPDNFSGIINNNLTTKHTTITK